MSGTQSAPDPSAFVSKVFFSKVTVSSVNPTTGRCLLGNSVGNLTVEQESLQLTAQAYDGNGHPVAALFRWVSSNPCCASVDSTGLVTRVKNNQCLSQDSNGLQNLSVQAGTSNLGGISTISAIAQLPNGADSKSGDIVIAVQAAAPRQLVSWPTVGHPSVSAPDSVPSVATGSFNLCSPELIGPNYSK
jgi:hypothetical protein